MAEPEVACAARRMEVIGDATLYLGDCMDILPGLAPVDAVVTDPPYGIGEAAGKNKNRGFWAIDYGDDDWDDEPASSACVEMVLAAGRWVVWFGGNYYQMAPSSCWLVWDKMNGGTHFADCELAWTNLPKAVRIIRHQWNGWSTGGERRGDHPTQKPVRVMEWAISHCPNAESVLDPFMGSGTTGVACAHLGRRFVGIEREQKYFDVACQRIARAYSQMRLFP